MSDDHLMAIGFERCSDNALRAPATSIITLSPTNGSYYRLTIRLPGGTVDCIVRAAALKIAREATRSEATIDPAALISGTARRRPW
jgi:hypothetical protein